MARPSPYAFTLIELLVVITIIVVLLALLTPALDRAIYAAQLAVCGANQSSVSMGVTTYAVQFARKYPHRKALNASGQPTQLNDPWTGGATPANTDDRLVIKEFIALDSFLDPVCDDLEIDPSETRPYAKDAAQNTPEPFVYAGFDLFYGWQYAGHRPMRALGDRFSYATGPSTTDLQGVTTTPSNLFGKVGQWEFGVITTDQNGMTRDTKGVVASHPDTKGVLALQTLRNEPVTHGTAGLGLDEGFYLVLSRWITGAASDRRGTIDANYGHADGGVVRLTALEWDDEEYVTSAPIALDGPGQFDYWLNIPR